MAKTAAAKSTATTAKGATPGVKKVHGQVLKLSAWVVFVLAIATSTLLVGTFVADWYRSLINQLPTAWTIGFCVIAGVVLVVLGIVDVLKDLEPNRGAVYAVLSLPTVLSAISGGFAEWVSGGADWVFKLVDQWLREAVPDGLGLGSDLIAIDLVVAVIMLANRFNKKR